MSKDDKELKQIWKLFQDSPQEIQERRQQITQAIHLDQTSEFPTLISIITALDELLGCFALGGQVKNYYRYGSYDSCARQREKFWFAVRNGELYEKEPRPLEEMSTKEISNKNTIHDFYKKRFLEDKARGSSEDIWDVRGKKLDNPFKYKSFDESSR